MTLLFVYNAKSDKMSAAIDFAHKIISPSTYACDLCKLTHGNFGERKEWKDFTAKSDHQLEFYHIDEFEKKFGQSYDYPVILKGEDPMEVLIDKSTMSKIDGVDELIKMIRRRTSEETQPS